MRTFIPLLSRKTPIIGVMWTFIPLFDENWNGFASRSLNNGTDVRQHVIILAFINNNGINVLIVKHFYLPQFKNSQLVIEMPVKSSILLKKWT